MIKSCLWAQHLFAHGPHSREMYTAPCLNKYMFHVVLWPLLLAGGQLCHWCFITSSELGIIQELLIEPTRTCIVYNGVINSLGWVFRIYYVGVNVAWLVHSNISRITDMVNHSKMSKYGVGTNNLCISNKGFLSWQKILFDAFGYYY